MEIKVTANKPIRGFIYEQFNKFMEKEVKTFSSLLGEEVTIANIIAAIQLIIFFIISVCLVTSSSLILQIASLFILSVSYAIFKKNSPKGAMKAE